MPIRVKLPNGQYGQFPDGTPHEQIESVLQKQFPPTENQSQPIAPQPNQGSSEDDEEEFPIPESTGLSGIGSDLLSAAFSAKDFAEDIPNKLENLGRNINENPVSGRIRPIGQLAAGAAEIGKGIVNAPYNLNQYLARKHLLPQIVGKLGKLIPHIPEDTGLENALGLKEDPEKGDDIIRAIPQLSAALSGGAIVGRGASNFLKSPDLKAVIRQTQKKVNESTAEMGKIFDTVEDEVSKRGISKVAIDDDLINQAQTFLAKTPANKKLINQAKEGDFSSLRKLQADLRVKGEKALSSAFAAENTMGEEILATRDAVNQSIENHLLNTGHKDLAKLLNVGREGYRQIQETYFSSPQLAKVFGKSQKVPSKPSTLLREESTEMKRFMIEHPEVKEALTKALKHEKRMNTVKNISKMIGAGAAGGTAVKVFDR